MSATVKVSVIGTGYVGLVAAACFAEHGHEVLCQDIDSTRIETLRAGKVPIYEPGLEDLVVRNHRDGRLRFCLDPAEAAQHGELVFLAVGTPRAENGAPDLRQVFAAARGLAPHLRPGTIVVDKSTVPVGTADQVAAQLREAGAAEVFVASNPEFLKEGSAVDDFMKPDRVVIGADEPKTAERLRALYASFFRASERIYTMSVRSAELTKYAANAYLATRISFINDIANLCEKVGANVEEVRAGMGADTRIGHHFLYPGVGYGGSCFPKDTRALVHTAHEHGASLRIVEAADDVNRDQKGRLFEKLAARFAREGLAHKRVAVWGLAFKPNTDDVREAPALTVVRSLIDAGAEVHVCDPVAAGNFMRALDPPAGSVTVHEDPYAALRGADALLLLTEWRQYRSPHWGRLRELMRGRVLLDGRNQWSRNTAETMGFDYDGIGR